MYITQPYNLLYNLSKFYLSQNCVKRFLLQAVSWRIHVPLFDGLVISHLCMTSTFLMTLKIMIATVITDI